MCVTHPLQVFERDRSSQRTLCKNIPLCNISPPHAHTDIFTLHNIFDMMYYVNLRLLLNSDFGIGVCLWSRR